MEETQFATNDVFTRSSLESLANRCEAAAEKYINIRHVMLVGPSPNLGVGGEMADIASTGDSFHAYRLIGDALATQGQLVGRVLSHDMVLLKVDDKNAFKGCWLFVRSIIYSLGKQKQNESLAHLQNLARQAYQHVRQLDLDIASYWNRIPGELLSQQRTEAHAWLVGVTSWAMDRSIPTVPVREGKSGIMGGPMFIQNPSTGKAEPLLGCRPGADKPEQMVEPERFILTAGLSSFEAPDDQVVYDLLKEMLADCKIYRPVCDVFSASANAIRWILGRTAPATQLNGGLGAKAAEETAVRLDKSSEHDGDPAPRSPQSKLTSVDPDDNSNEEVDPPGFHGLTSKKLQKRIGISNETLRKAQIEADLTPGKTTPKRGQHDFKFTPHTIKRIADARKKLKAKDDEVSKWNGLLKEIGQPKIGFQIQAKSKRNPIKS